MPNNILGVDIGGSHITTLPLRWAGGGALVPTGPLITTKVDTFQDRATILDAWLSHLQERIDQEAVNPTDTLAIAMPGPFNYETSIAQFTPGLKLGALNGLNIRATLLRELPQIRQVYFENDAACFALGAAQKFSAAGYLRLMTITLGTGIGSAFVVKGQLMKTGPSIPPDGEIYQLPFKAGKVDDYFGTRWFTSYAEENFGIVATDLLELIDIADTSTLEQLFTTYARNLKELLLPVCEKFRPDALVMGGNIAHTYPRFAPAFAPGLYELNVNIHDVPDQAEYLTALGAGQIVSL